MQWIIAQAWAQEQAAGGLAQVGAGGLTSFLPLILIFVIFYFLLIRPQQKKMREHQKMVQSLRRGDKIVTSGGMLGTVTRVEETEGVLHVEIAPQVVVRIKRDTVASVLSHPQPASSEKS